MSSIVRYIDMYLGPFNWGSIAFIQSNWLMLFALGAAKRGLAQNQATTCPLSSLSRILPPFKIHPFQHIPASSRFKNPL